MIRIRRTKNREYRDAESGGVTLLTPAEYAVVDGKQLLARIVFMGDGWRACRSTNGSSIGYAVSPIGMNRFKAVRDWVLENLEME